MTLDLSVKTPRNAHVWTRDPFDWYVEPEASTTLLLSVERFPGGIYDPACGQGNIVFAAKKAGYLAMGSDIVDRTAEAPWFKGAYDFLDRSRVLCVPPNIICNPPFHRAKGTENFIRRALEVASGKVAIFADIRFLASGRRARGLYEEHPPHRVWILADRPSCPPGEYLAAGHAAGGGTADWCWLIWDLTAPPAHRSEIGWLYRAGVV